MKKKKIFITGANSFIGKNLLKKIGDNYNFYGIDKSSSKLNNIKKIDLCSRKLELFLEKDTDLVLNLAAISNDQSCNLDPFSCYQTNIVGLINLLEIIKKKKIKNLIHASTEWVYEENTKVHSEAEKIFYENIKSHYALTKLFNEQILRIFHENNKEINITCLRFGIIYGKRKKNWSAFESIIDKVIKKKILTVGSLKTGRHFIHIDDIVRAIIISFNNSGFNIFNVQGKDFVTLDMLIKESTKLLNKKIKIKETSSNIPSVRKMSLSKTKKKLMFTANISYKQGIREIINFFKNDK